MANALTELASTLRERAATAIDKRTRASAPPPFNPAQLAEFRALRSHEARTVHEQQLVAAINATVATEVDALNAKIVDAKHRGPIEVATVQAAATAARRELHGELIAGVRSDLAQLVADWSREPTRAIAGEIRDRLTKWIERERIELANSSILSSGATHLTTLVLAHSFCDLAIARQPSAANVFAASSSGLPERFMNAIYGAALVDTATMYAAIGALESEILAGCRASKDEPASDYHLARWKITREQDPEALTAFEAAVAGAAQRKFLASYVPPPMTSMFGDSAAADSGTASASDTGGAAFGA
jgi:hypothetical protein